MRDANKIFVIKCRRCGREFTSHHGNELYCSYPSVYPEDKGKTCKQLRRVESKHATKLKQEAFIKGIQEGKYIITEKYGCIPKDVLMNRFENYLMKKHELKDYMQCQTWSTLHPDIVGEDYDAFQKEIGMKLIDDTVE